MKRNTNFKYPYWIVNTKYGKTLVQARDKDEALITALNLLVPEGEIVGQIIHNKDSDRYCPVDDVIYSYYVVGIRPFKGIAALEMDEICINQYYEDGFQEI